MNKLAIARSLSGIIAWIVISYLSFQNRDSLTLSIIFAMVALPFGLHFYGTATKAAKAKIIKKLKDNLNRRKKERLNPPVGTNSPYDTDLGKYFWIYKKSLSLGLFAMLIFIFFISWLFDHPAAGIVLSLIWTLSISTHLVVSLKVYSLIAEQNNWLENYAVEYNID